MLNQLINPKNKGLFKRAIIMSGIIRSPYETDSFIEPGDLSSAEKKGESFFEFLGVKSLEEARKIDAFELRNKYTEYAGSHPRFSPCIDNIAIPGDAVKLIMKGDYHDVELMAGNTEDEFLSPIPAGKESELPGISSLNGIEASCKAVFSVNGDNGRKNGYYYKFKPDIPGWDNPGTFHSVDLWFFFNTLDKCWRPLVGRHYDLARKMSLYWVNFIRTGNPNGEDVDDSRLPEWKPVTRNDRNEMQFTSDGPVATVDNSKEYVLLSNLIEKKCR